jgi:hypothetical protein
MQTPAGQECSYFYGDYFRGRSREECRLLSSASPPLPWNRELCFSCPVPEIQLANACKHMVLIPRLERPFPFLKRRVRVSTYCNKTERENFDPHIGCGECHSLPPVFFGDVDESDPSA